MQQLAAERVVFSRGRLAGSLIVVFLGCNRGIAKGGKLVSIRGGSTFCSTIRNGMPNSIQSRSNLIQ